MTRTNETITAVKEATLKQLFNDVKSSVCNHSLSHTNTHAACFTAGFIPLGYGHALRKLLRESYRYSVCRLQIASVVHLMWFHE